MHERMTLNLLVPDLIWPEPADAATFDGLQCPVLETLLARAVLHRTPPAMPVAGTGMPPAGGPAFESVLSVLFRQSPQAPFGTLRLLGEEKGTGEAYPNGWHCADPVHLRFHQERIILADASRLAIQPEEAAALVESLNREFAGRGQFHMAHPERWYVRFNDDPATSEAPLSTVAGRRILMSPARDAATRALRQIQNEIQMILHGHPVNQAREAQGLSPVNGIWLWGGGKLPLQSSADFDVAWSNLPLVRGLAKFEERDVLPLPPDLAAVLAEEEYVAPLIVLDALQAPALYEEGDGWRQALQGLEANWFAHLPALLAGGRVTQVNIYSNGIYGQLHWRIEPLQRWKFWQRPQPLAELARQLAGPVAPAAG